MKTLLFPVLFVLAFALQAQVRQPVIGTISIPDNKEIKLTLIARIQSYNPKPVDNMDFYDPDIVSPKSVAILEDKHKFYINSLEGYKTVVYDLMSYKKIKVINHDFKVADAHLFKENTVLNYNFISPPAQPNVFKGKPVESCFSHNGKYLYVTYYRRSYDNNAMEPSAMAVIDTDKDEIVRVIPTGPLPKMIACSPDNKYIAVTHWGDNTVGILDISSGDPMKFKFVKQFVVEYQAKFTASDKNKAIDRDVNCGFCLRGTAFTKDSKYLLVGRMGSGGIVVFDMQNLKPVRTVLGMKTNVRHLVVTENYLFLSSNKTGYVQKTPINDFIKFALNDSLAGKQYTKWQECYVGSGARTIEVTDDEKYVFAAVNNESKLVAVRVDGMVKVAEITGNSFPVGLGIRRNNFLVISTSQAHPGVGGGNCVNIYYLKYLDQD